jgi:hypothetical protein
MGRNMILFVALSEAQATGRRPGRAEPVNARFFCQIDKSIVFLYTLAVLNSNPIDTGG